MCFSGSSFYFGPGLRAVLAEDAIRAWAPRGDATVTRGEETGVQGRRLAGGAVWEVRHGVRVSSDYIRRLK
jgi:hypothetical protein